MVKQLPIKVAVLCTFFLIIWIMFMILSSAYTGSIFTIEQAVSSVSNPNLIFYLTYINAIMFTLLVTALFVCLYLYCKSAQPELSLIGLIFVPVYCTFNLFSYFSQISIIPKLLFWGTTDDYKVVANFITAMMTQGWIASPLSMFNNFAYALLGIPSIIFGIILLDRGKCAKTAGVLLILNAIACLLGISGIVFNIKYISHGTFIGGIIFTFAVIYLWRMFKTEDKDFR